MNFENFTTRGISETIQAQIDTALRTRSRLFPKAFRAVIAKVIAGVFIILYKYGSFIFLQIFVRTASSKNTTINGVTVNPLLFWGRLIGASDPTAATQAEIVIEVISTNPSELLRAGAQLINSATGVTYVTLVGVALNDSVVEVRARAVQDANNTNAAGAVGNVDDGATTLSFANPLPGVARQVTVLRTELMGTEGEDLEAYRLRVIDLFQRRPQGGAYADWAQWAGETPGVVNVYPYTGLPGRVNVYIEADPTSAGNADGIPTTAILENVLNFVNLDGPDGRATRRNANAFPNVLPITRLRFAVEIAGLASVDDPAQTRVAILAALTEYFLAAEPFIPGLSVPPRVDRLTTTQISAVVEEIVTAQGGTFTGIELTHPVVGLVNVYSLQEGEKAALGDVVGL